MKSHIPTTILALVLFAVSLSVILWGKDFSTAFESFGDPNPFDAKAELWQVLQGKRDAMSNLQAAVPNVIEKRGIVAAELLAREAFQQGAIDLGQCHTLLHITGHYAYSFYERDLKRIARDNLLVCGNAYQHGVEAEIVMRSQDATRELREFCSVLQIGRPYATCYHGAGHAFMYDARSVEQSLSYCDRLNGVPTSDSIDDCYEGVFSEYTTASGEMDGHTGLHLVGGSRAELPFDRPLDFCQTLPLKYQSACAAQVSRIVYRSHSPEDALRQCVTESYSDDLKAGCLRTVSALIAREELYRNGKVEMPSFVASLPEHLRKTYLWGIALEFWMLRDSGLGKDDANTCMSLENESDRDYCTRILNSR